ncbi:MAG: hypothetical protein WAZ50_03025 [Minisyncoccia bacterium]
MGVYDTPSSQFGTVDKEAFNQLLSNPVEPYKSPGADSLAEQAQAPEPRSAMGEVWSQLKAGVFSDLPRMAGKAMQYASTPGNRLYDTGKGLVEDANAIATLPEMQPGDTTGRPIVDALAKGARMIPQSIAPAVGAGLVLSGVGAPAGVALIGGSALAAVPAGLAQAQETWEKGIAKHGLTAEQAAAMPDDPRAQEATNAARTTGGIEWGGELAGGALAGRFLGIGGSMAKSAIGRMLNKGEQTAAQSVLKSFTNPGTVGRFAGNAIETAAGETAVEMGQSFGEADVERHYGYDNQNPWDAAKGAIAPTLGMSALLMPFGIPAHASQAVKVDAIASALQNPDTAPEIRSQAAEIIYNELAKQSPDAAANFAAHSFDAIHGDQDTGSAPYSLSLDDNVLHPLTPRALQKQQSEPEGALTRAVSAGAQPTDVRIPQPGLGTGATDLLQDSAPLMQSAQQADTNTADEQPVNHFAVPTFQTGVQTETAAFSSPVQAPVIPADNLHGTLQHFIKSGQKKTGQSGQAVHVWEKPDKRFLDKVVSDYLQPAAAQGLVSLDTEGGYNVHTDQGGLRIVPPSEPQGNYRIDYYSAQNVTEPVSLSTTSTPQLIPGESRKPSPELSNDAWLEKSRDQINSALKVVVPINGHEVSLRATKALELYGKKISQYDKLKEHKGSLSRRSKKFGLSRQEQDEIRSTAAEYEADGYSRPDAIEKAVIDHLEELKFEREQTISQIRSSIGEPENRDATSTTNTRDIQTATVVNNQSRQTVFPNHAAVRGAQGPNIAPIDPQAHEAATSPTNDVPQPTQAQIDVGNYKKGHIRIHGLDITIENPAGSTRSGTDETGRDWSTKLKHHYGYIKGTEARDKDHIDVFVKPGTDQTNDKGKVFVVDQKNTATGRFDESKILIGFDSLSTARSAYLSNYDASGKDRIAAISETTTEAFKQWLNEGNTKKPFAKPSAVITRKAIETAFPGQVITQDAEGHTVALKNGATVKITTTGDISFDVAAAEAAYGRTVQPGEKPVASFQALARQAVITLTEQGAGEIHHEAFHTAMALALNGKQRAWILNKYGTEEAAAAEYQRLRDNGSFETRKDNVPLMIRTLYNFFSKIRALLDQTHVIMADVASGEIWNKSATAATPTPSPVKYSLATINDKATAAKKHLAAAANKSTFVKQDVAPAMKATGEGIAAAWDGIKAAVNPMDRSAAAEEAGRILIEGMGHMEHGKEKFINELNKAAMQAAYSSTRLTKALDLMETSTTLADKLFTRMPEKERIDFMQRMDTGQPQATKELQQVADAIKTMFEDKAKAVQALGTGALETARENYFPHVWDKSEDARREISTRISKRPLEGSKGFSKARVFEDINAGIEAGFKLVDANPINLVFLKMAEMDKYINAHVALQAMETSGLVELIPAGERMPDGYGDISGKYGMVTKRAHQDSATGEPGEVKSYRYIAREDVAQVFNNYLSPNLYNNKYLGKPFTAYMKAANTLNQFQLGVFSAFHAGFTSLEAVISHAALGIKALTRGDFKEAATYFKHAPAAWYLNPKLGNKVMKAWMGDETAAREMPQIIQWLEMAGARRIMDSRFQTDQTQKMFQAWSEDNKIGAGLRSIPAIVEQSARPILEWLVPRQKLGVFTEMANEWSRHHPAASHEATRKAMQQIWNRVDSRLGQVVYDRLFVHNIAKNLTQAFVRAPGWTGGTILEVGGGLKDLATYAKALATKGKQAELSDRAAYTLSLLTVTALANAILTAAFTGEPPQDWKDLLAFRTGKKDEKGNPERWMLPTYAKDLYAYTQKPGTTLMHKAHPLLSLIGDLANNEDYYGTEIRHQGDNPIFQLAQAGKFTAKAFTPFWMRGAAKVYERGGSVAAMAAPLIGIMPAPADLNKTEAERLASEMVQARMPKGTKTQEQFERSQLIQHLSGLARRDPAEAGKEIRQALQERNITGLQARHIMQNARLAPIQIAFKRLSYEEAQRVYEVATPAEKKKLGILLARKRYLSAKAS